MERKKYIRSNNRVGREEIISSKLNKEVLDNVEVCEILHLPKSTFDHQMEKFNRIYSFTDSDFKKNGFWIFSKEWHGLFLALLSSLPYHPSFHRDEKKQIKTHLTHGEFFEKLYNSVQTYLPKEQLKDVEYEISYSRTKLELSLMNEIEINLSGSFFILQQMPPSLRLQSLFVAHNGIKVWKAQMSQLLANHYLEISILRENFTEEAQAEMELEDIEFDQMLANKLREAIHSEEPSELEQEQEITNESLATALIDELIYSRLRVHDNEKMDDIVEEAHKEIYQQANYAEILEKVHSALEPLDSPEAEVVTNWIKNVLLLLQTSERKSSSSDANIKKLLRQLMYSNATYGLSE